MGDAAVQGEVPLDEFPVEVPSTYESVEVISWTTFCMVLLVVIWSLTGHHVK